MNSKFDCIALVVFFGPNDGGRSTPPQSGYRPQLQIGDEKTSCSIISVARETSCFEFGVQHKVGMSLMFPERHHDQLKVGFLVKLFEGSKLVGEGAIVEMP